MRSAILNQLLLVSPGNLLGVTASFRAIRDCAAVKHIYRLRSSETLLLCRALKSSVSQLRGLLKSRYHRVVSVIVVLVADQVLFVDVFLGS